jgi:hypothetical protein
LRASRAANRSRPPADERLKPFIDAGRDLFNRRQGQLNLFLRAVPRRQLGQTPSAVELDAYVIYVGFDPEGAVPAKPPPPKSKPKPKTAARTP